MSEGSPAKTTPPARPQLGGMRSSSYLQTNQQYQGPNKPESHFGIDTVVEDLNNSRLSPAKTFSPFNGVPSKEEPPRIVDGGSHDYTHPNCSPAKGQKSNRLIATLTYKTTSPRAANVIPSPRLSGSESDIPANLAPTTSIDEFPLEPPVAEPEPLDHLYGSYISPLCITSFLHLMSTFPLPPGVTEITSSHRCLDDPVHPNIVELTLSPAPSLDYLPLADLRKHELIYRFEREWNIDVALQRDTLWRRHPRLVAFDMDSTLITQEVIDLMAATIKDPPNLAEKIADITHRAMNGELEFESAFRERVALLKGLPETVFEQLHSVLNVTKGVPQLLKALKKLGVKTAVFSGGFQPLTAWLAKQLGIDYAYANEVEIDDAGRFTGEVKGVIVGREQKKKLLIEVAAKEGIALEQTVAVGDGANDLSMLATAGLGVAWNAKPRVQMEASARLNGESMTDLLYLFGFTREEIELLTE